MPKQFILFILILIMLIGCQSKEDTNTLRADAEEVYLSIKDEIQNGESRSDSEYDKAIEFKEKYLFNMDDYRDEQELLSSMEKLIFGYESYQSSKYQGKEENTVEFKRRVDEALSELDLQFNNY
ncbi:hypothetical protein [Peribacillus sp. Hz7]|uniref:hypothetical protein n=1 Tax=Peribacillus sp. Hz7 TaxID=3344873 RepID=UPI0035C9FC25